MFNGGGTLAIAPGRITLTAKGFTRRATGVAEVVHTARSVTLVKARLVPPWFNTALILHSDDDKAAIAGTWLGARARLRAALVDAGFEVREVSTWFSTSDRAERRAEGFGDLSEPEASCSCRRQLDRPYR